MNFFVSLYSSGIIFNKLRRQNLEFLLVPSLFTDTIAILSQLQISHPRVVPTHAVMWQAQRAQPSDSLRNVVPGPPDKFLLATKKNPPKKWVSKWPLKVACRSCCFFWHLQVVKNISLPLAFCLKIWVGNNPDSAHKAVHIFSETIWIRWLCVSWGKKKCMACMQAKNCVNLLIRLQLQYTPMYKCLLNTHLNQWSYIPRTPIPMCHQETMLLLLPRAGFPITKLEMNPLGPWMGRIISRHFSSRKIHRKNTTNLHHLDLVLLVFNRIFFCSNEETVRPPRYVKTNSWDTYCQDGSQPLRNMRGRALGFTGAPFALGDGWMKLSQASTKQGSNQNCL